MQVYTCRTDEVKNAGGILQGRNRDGDETGPTNSSADEYGWQHWLHYAYTTPKQPAPPEVTVVKRKLTLVL